MSKITHDPTRYCDRCGEEGELATEAEAQARFNTKVSNGQLPVNASLESYDWLQHCGSNVWFVFRQAA